MLLHITQDHHRVSVISFPRDLVLAVQACLQIDGSAGSASSRVLLHTTLARGGFSWVVLAIEKLTGLHFPFAAQIRFDGATASFKAVGVFRCGVFHTQNPGISG
ncbi:hypothetical protein E3O55_07675 [Cryobacterium sp. MDB1-18-2]|uniref:LCP family glycopolymer transferase n=1 Tax=unclassified Cryobacterium TaxID=2649013 RepID=UPI00106A6923|nr:MULTISPECIES: LCP family protein [unclassified Cryobacterium]TFB94410.1 hypothetical protein E3O39_14930 [Cryobacterium sp. MDB2-A-1]TFC08236.1 hypothetical protein E3O35_17790 [Cryobacterium sp. MDB2-A-2]TFC30626.1 hypothetical protein E3O55_07675 [Cryobacterium sp. MDB1-18-2]TFC41975.1 hypothetical protein E3O50_09415 [Cryobacterium sp. MDB1-18-1]